MKAILESVCRMICEAMEKPFVNGGDRTVVDGSGDELNDHAWRVLHSTSFPAGDWKLTGWELDNETLNPIKLKIEQISAPSVSSVSVGESGNAVRYNDEHQGVEILFPGKPAREVLDRCKANGFRWSMRSKVWYHKFTERAWKTAHEIAGIAVAPLPSGARPDPAGAYVQAQEDAYQDNLARAIGA